jgi:hypothetical protein
MNQNFQRALAAAGADVTYDAHPGGHDPPNFSAEIRAMFAWGLFAPVVEHPRAWVNQTVATHGKLWDIRYRFAQPPGQVVTFRRSGRAMGESSSASVTRRRQSILRRWPA